MKQKGFTLVMAIFILLVTSLLGIYMLRMSAVELDTSNYAFQGARAYQAARAGIEWAVADILNGGNCTQVSAQTAMTFTGINGFTVSLSCSSQTFSEGSLNPIVYTITATSQYGVFSASNYASRQITITLVN